MSPLRKILWFAGLFLSLAALSIVWSSYQQSRTFLIPSAILQQIGTAARNFSSKDTCSCTWKTMPFRKKNYYRLHRKAGSGLTDAELISDTEHQLELQSKDVLVPIGDSNGYIVQQMRYGSPYLHKDALKMLEEIEERFLQKQIENNLPHARFVISSAARTAKQQKRLQKTNKNATKGISSHSYGASIDIPRIIGHKCKQQRVLLREVLEEMQQEKKVYLTPESVTIHVTAR